MNCALSTVCDCDRCVVLLFALGMLFAHLGQLSEPQSTESVCLILASFQVSQAVARDSVQESSRLSTWPIQHEICSISTAATVNLNVAAPNPQIFYLMFHDNEEDLWISKLMVDIRPLFAHGFKLQILASGLLNQTLKPGYL